MKWANAERVWNTPKCFYTFEVNILAMENTELSHLQKEIALRGRIIETLVSANEELRHKCSHLVSFLVSKTANYSPAEKEWLENMLGDWLRENGNGTTNLRYSITENGNGTPNLGCSIHENGNGTPNVGYSIHEKGNGTPNVGSSLTENGNGTTKLGYSVPENGKGTTTQLRPLPEKMEPGKFSVFNLRKKIIAHTHYKGKSSAIDSTANLLVHIYNGGDCGYPTLKKVTQLSTGGLGKMLMSLTKKGLIKRTGLQKLALTESARSLLQHTWHEAVR